MPFLKLLRVVPRWAWAVIALVVAAFLFLEHHQRLVAERDSAIGQWERVRLEANALQSALEWRRAQAARQLQALEAREAELETVKAEHSERLKALEQLEQNDEETADWASVAVPNAVRDWLRQLPREAGGADRDDARSAAVPDDATSQAETRD